MSLTYLIHTSAEKTMTIAQTPSISPSNAASRSPWHSPVPYLFGGLAAMLGLIAFALLVLACSYWRLSGYLEGEDSNERDLEAGSDEGSDDLKKAPPVYEEKFLVIMAGQDKPTCLATPMWCRASSFGSTSKGSCTNLSNETSFVENKDKIEGNVVQVEMTDLTLDATQEGGVLDSSTIVRTTVESGSESLNHA